MSASVGGSLAKGVSSVATAFEFAEELEIAVMIAPAGMEPAHLGDGLRDLRIDGIHGHAECEGEVIKIHPHGATPPDSHRCTVVTSASAFSASTC